jgi:phosphatidate cytidylyltransferase
MQFWSEPLSVLNLSVLVFPVALYSVIGDLFESMVKRRSGVKDSGAILPGHGGVLDRIDGIMAALPMYALLLNSNYSL